MDDLTLVRAFRAEVAVRPEARERARDELRRAIERRRGPRPSRLVLVAAAALVVLLAGTAYALGREFLDWSTAEPAPERTQLAFSELSVHAPRGMDPQVIPNSARKVTTARVDGRRHTLWVAPTKRGGFCVEWEELFGGCVADRTPANLPPDHGADVNTFALGPTYSTNEEGAVTVVGGHLLDDEISELIVEYADGERARIPFVWVSPPIDAGFYLHDVPGRHRRPGRHVVALVALDAAGDVVARQSFRLARALPPIP